MIINAQSTDNYRNIKATTTTCTNILVYFAFVFLSGDVADVVAPPLIQGTCSRSMSKFIISSSPLVVFFIRTSILFH